LLTAPKVVVHPKEVFEAAISWGSTYRDVQGLNEHILNEELFS